MNLIKISIPDSDKTWEKLIEKNENANDLDGALKIKAKNALYSLKSLLGDQFIKNCYDNGHRLLLKFDNQAPWAKEWVIWLDSSLHNLSGCNGFEKYICRFKDAKYPTDVISLLNWANAFHLEGFGVELEPVINNNKKPDLLIQLTSNNEKIFIEISDTCYSDRQIQANKSVNAIFQTFFGSLSGLLFAGRIYRVLSDRHIDELKNRIKDSLDEMVKDNRFKILSEEGVIDLGFSHEFDKDKFTEWVFKNNLRLNSIYEPQSGTNEIARITLKIKEEHKQLPIDSIGLIIINNNLLIHPNSNLESIAYNIEETIFDLPNVLCVIISGGWGGSIKENRVIQVGNHKAFICRIDDMFTNQYLVLQNRFCSFNLSEESLEAIFRSFSLNKYQTTYC
jgi:hypothetical protein